MSFLEIFLLSIGLAMDAAAVSMTNGMVYRKNPHKKSATIAISFGAFQGLMPLLGFYLGSLFYYYIDRYSGIIIFIILSVIGFKMIKDSMGECEGKECKDEISYREIFMQAIATSIDAFAVGVGFSAAAVDIVFASGTIAVVTAIISALAIYIGKKCGDCFGKWSSLAGGVILVAIGFKALL